MGAKRMKKIVEDDKISVLPDEILSFILSFLTMKEAVRTGILSRRWKSVWKTSVSSSPNICLDVLTMRGSDYPTKFFWSYMCSQQLHGGSLMVERRKFVKFAYRILQLDHRPVKDLFRIRFCLRKDSSYHIDQWINMAVNKRCQKLDIDLSHFHNGEFYDRNEELYMFPAMLFTEETGSSVKCLSLKSCIFMSLDTNRFSSLIDLRLEDVLIDKASIVSIMCYCLHLENLFIDSCKSLFSLKICGPSLKLKDLTIHFCCNLKKIKIEANKLTKLQYTGYPVKFTFVKVPQLSNVIICTKPKNSCGALSYALGKLSSDIPKLKSLTLSVVPLEEKKIPRQLPLFTNLRRLVLTVTYRGGTLSGFIPLLQASPYLQKLELYLSVWDHNASAHETGLMEMPSDFLHVHLKEIILSGFSDCAHDIEFTTYMLKYAATLKRISIFCRNLRMDHAVDFLRRELPRRMKKLAGTKAVKQMMQKAWKLLVECLSDWDRNASEHETGLMEMPSDSPHVHLKEIILSGFSDCAHDIEFTTYMLKYAATVGKSISISILNLIMDHVLDFLRRELPERMEKLAATRAEKQKKMQNAWKQLVESVRPDVKLLLG